MSSFIEELNTKIAAYKGRPQVIYVTWDEYNELLKLNNERQWLASPITKYDQAFLYRTLPDSTPGICYDDVPVKVLKRSDETQIASLLNKKQLAILLVDSDEKVRNIAYEVLRFFGEHK